MTLYGIAEAAYGTSNTTGRIDNASGKYNLKSAGLTNGTGNGRWGIKGTEDIGNGLKANFVAEAQLLIADGTIFDQTEANQTVNDQKTNVFGGKTRQTLVGLQNNLGALNLGYKKGVEQVFSVLRAEFTEEPTNWSRRYKANLEKLASGDVVKVSEVVRDLWRRDQDRGLSAGEKRMLAKARQILVSELALARKVDEVKASATLDEVLAS